MTLYKRSLFVILQCTSPRIAIDSRNLQVNGLKGNEPAEDILLYIFTSPTSIVTRLSEPTDCKCNIASAWNFPKFSRLASTYSGLSFFHDHYMS